MSGQFMLRLVSFALQTVGFVKFHYITLRPRHLSAYSDIYSVPTNATCRLNPHLPTHFAVAPLIPSIQHPPTKSPLVASALTRMKCYFHSLCSARHKRITF